MRNNLNIKSSYDPIGSIDKDGTLIKEYRKPKNTSLSEVDYFWDNFNKNLYNQIIKKRKHV